MMRQFWSSVRRSQLAHADHLASTAFTMLFGVPAMLFVKGPCFSPEPGAIQQASVLLSV